MSKYVKSGTDYNYKVLYKVDGNFVTPSSATITVQKNDGTVVGSIEDTALTIPVGATSSLFTISGANNTATLNYEVRYVNVEFVYNSKTYYINDFYTLRTSLLLPITKEEVRNFVGMDESELSDEQIDLFSAYDELKADVTEANIDTLLSSGSSLIPSIKTALKAKAAINGLTMIETLLFQSKQADNTLFKRFSDVDFNSMLARLTSQYNAAVSALNGVVEGEAVSVTPFLISTGTDPVTNS